MTLNKELLTFIYQTAHLRKLQIKLCNHVCQHENSDAYIKQLRKLGIIIKSQFSPQTYRYPSFFNHYLRENFLVQNKGNTKQLHERALSWNILHKTPAESLFHALELSNIDTATNVIKRFARQLIVSGEITLLQRYFKTLSIDELTTNSFLKYVYVWTLVITQKFIEAKIEINKLAGLVNNNIVEAGFEHLTPTLSEVKILKYRVRQALDPEWSDPTVWCKLLDSEGDTFFKEQIALSLGSAYLRREQFTQAYTAFLDSKYYADANATAITAITALSRMAYIRKIEGRLIEAKGLCEEAIDLSIQNYGTRIPVVAVPLLILSEIEYELNRIDVSEVLHLSASKLFEQYDNRIFQVQAIIHGAKLANYYHGPANAIRLLIKAKNIVSSRSDSHLHRLVCAEQIKYHLKTGEVAMAKSLLANEDISIDKRTPNPSFNCSSKDETIYSAFARYLINVGRFADASAWLTKMLHQAKEQKRICFCVELAGLLALVHAYIGDENKMLRGVRELLFLGEQSNSTRSILDLGDKIMPLIKKYQTYYIKVEDLHGPSTSYIQDLVKFSNELRTEKVDSYQSKTTLPPTNTSSQQLPVPPSIHNLTQREIDVLVLICEGYSNKKIAQELILGEGTVKWHVKNIFAKLYVANRTQAAAVGRELGILD
nr:LuxR C-terminal-related transcriptional regulator [Paraglaciecola arctica]